MPNKKIIILIVIICIALIAALVYYYANNKIGVLSPLAQINNQTCNQPAGRENDLCLKQAALSQVSPEICQIIEDADLKLDCLSNVKLASAIEKQDFIACQALDNLMLAQTCLQRIINKNYETADCDSLSQKELVVFCLSEKNGFLARKTGDEKLCEQIPESIKKANCLSELKKIDLHSDNDKDGLDFLQEIINGTDPDNSDTDNDGNPDGVEIANGYNPDGPGKLNEFVPSKIMKCEEIKDVKLKLLCLAEFSNGQIDLAECNFIKTRDLFNYCLNEKQLFLNQLKQ